MQEKHQPNFPNRLTNRLGNINEVFGIDGEKKQKIADITSSIQEQFNTNDRLKQYEDVTGYPVQNDYGLSESYDEGLRKVESSNDLNIAVVVGNGGVLSYLPEFASKGIDLVIFLDISPSVLEFVGTEVGNVIQAKDPSILTKDLVAEQTDERTAYEYENSLLPFMVGNRHYSSSAERLKAVQSAIGKVSLATALVNFFSPEDMGRLGTILHSNEAKVVLVNSTNVWNYQPSGESTHDHVETLKLLPLHQDCPIIYSDGGASGPFVTGAVAMRPTTIDTLEAKILTMSGEEEVLNRREELDEIHKAEIAAYEQSQ